MVSADQDARKAAIASKFEDKKAIEAMQAIDRKNTTRLKAIVEEKGWPGKSLVGEDGAHEAWLLVQHADLDRPFQKKCLDLLKEAVAKEEAKGSDLAYLTDRVLVAEGKKQRYGTQFVGQGDAMKPSPIEDEANVDQRRKEVGLGTMAEYRERLRQVYRADPAKKP